MSFLYRLPDIKIASIDVSIIEVSASNLFLGELMFNWPFMIRFKFPSRNCNARFYKQRQAENGKKLINATQHPEA